MSKLNKFFYTFLTIFISFMNNAYADYTDNGDVQINLDTPRGIIKVVLFKQKEPELVNFFLKYVNSGFYNKLIFHRIIEGFVLQGGAYDSSFTLKELPLKSQISFTPSDLKNSFGTLSIVMRKDNSTITSPQFFINLADNNFLNSVEGNFEYDVIGKVVSGMDLVEKIARIKVGQREGMHNVPFYPNEAIINQIAIEKIL